jgi:hypothetical protein
MLNFIKKIKKMIISISSNNTNKMVESVLEEFETKQPQQPQETKMTNIKTPVVNKEMTEAVVEFTSTVTKNILDMQAKTWQDMVKLGELATKSTTDMYKDIPMFKSFTNPWAK